MSKWMKQVIFQIYIPSCFDVLWVWCECTMHVYMSSSWHLSFWVYSGQDAMQLVSTIELVNSLFLARPDGASTQGVEGWGWGKRWDWWDAPFIFASRIPSGCWCNCTHVDDRKEMMVFARLWRRNWAAWDVHMFRAAYVNRIMFRVTYTGLPFSYIYLLNHVCPIQWGSRADESCWCNEHGKYVRWKNKGEIKEIPVPDWPCTCCVLFMYNVFICNAIYL